MCCCMCSLWPDAGVIRFAVTDFRSLLMLQLFSVCFSIMSYICFSYKVWCQKAPSRSLSISFHEPDKNIWLNNSSFRRRLDTRRDAQGRTRTRKVDEMSVTAIDNSALGTTFTERIWLQDKIWFIFSQLAGNFSRRGVTAYRVKKCEHYWLWSR